MTSTDRPFLYHGCTFTCSAVQTATNLFTPHVRYEHGLPGLEQMALPVDTAPYLSADEALRHAEQQAVRWVHDRTGDGQGRF
ncbi:hypothetical protein [Variovorax ginsengisoli]|uniref:Uncharacterized protein n=1 Tax=Variovorax ginsengisoli TaxID=363844 RepID=A0ABT9S8S8_9BURK|nr:hypothetical protein [Variovorax ginsengisoli]MDP9900762.1 hypothetical protein [Variovorax ginsengisoli]